MSKKDLGGKENPDTWGAWAEGDEQGAYFHVHCDTCGNYLTSVKLNNFCVIDMDVECSNCHRKLEGRNLRATAPIRKDYIKD